MAIARIVSTSFGNTNSFAFSNQDNLTRVFSAASSDVNRRYSTKDSNLGEITLRGTTPIIWPPTIPYLIPIFRFAVTPSQFQFSGLSDNYQELSRPNREPLIFRQNSNLLKVDFSALIGNPDGLGTSSCEDQLKLLKVIAKLRMSYTLAGAGPFIRSQQWVISGLDVNTLRMNPQQQITLAQASFSLTGLPDDDASKYRIPGMIAIKDVPLAVRQAAGGGGLRTETGSREVWSKIPR
jgi:hypothetical protein